jgi:protein-tyrosine phosphatase
MNKYIDIHSHLIPQFDDGPKDFQESLKMLRQAEDQGITDVFATSHFNERIPEETELDYFKKLSILREKANDEKLSITIHSGAEIFYHHFIENTVKKSKVTTFGNWEQYVLLEFPMFQMPDGAEEVLFRLVAEKYIPIVAHPERYVKIVEKPRRILNFIRYGGLLQVNGGSILGHFGKEIQKLSIQLLEQELIHFIASDSHSATSRQFVLKAVYEFLQDKISQEYLDKLLYLHPRMIIDKTPINPIQLPEEGKQGLIGTLRNRFKSQL